MFPLGQVPNRVNRENVPVMRLESSITAGHFPYKDTCQKYSVNHGYTCKRVGLHWTREFIFPYKCKIAGLQHILGSSYFTAWLQCSWRLHASKIRYHTQSLQYLVWNTYAYYFVQPLTRETKEHTHINTHTQSHPLNQPTFVFKLTSSVCPTAPKIFAVCPIKLGKLSPISFSFGRKAAKATGS